jgi:hypothetical protein
MAFHSEKRNACSMSDRHCVYEAVVSGPSVMRRDPARQFCCAEADRRQA